jgi:hypothetical protein
LKGNTLKTAPPFHHPAYALRRETTVWLLARILLIAVMKFVIITVGSVV